MADANTEYFDASLRHHIGVRRYTDGEVRRILKLLDASDADLVRRIEDRVGKAVEAEGVDRTLARLEALLDGVRRARSEALGVLSASLTDDLTELAKLEASVETDLLSAHVPVVLELAGPTAAALRAVVYSRPFQGRVLAEWADRLVAADRARLEQTLRVGLVEGETVQQLVQRVRGTRAAGYADGAIAATRRDAETVVRTAVNHVSNAARAEVWKANADVASEVRWTATLDGRTSAVCRARDGQTFPVDSGPRPPAHFGCRSIVVAVIDGQSLIGDRPEVRDARTRRVREMDFRAEAKAEAGDAWRGMNETERRRATAERRRVWTAENVGQVPAATTYGQWLSRQSETFQDEVLGAAKGRLFRDGGLTLDQFVSRQGDELTLEQLRKRHQDAFRRAGL